mgnify:CR=1 FL=1
MGREMDSDDEAFTEAFDKREMDELVRKLGPVMRQHGIGTVEPSKASVEQRRRERELVAGDRAYRAAERARKEAEERIRNGDIASSEDATIKPTPEWERQGETRSYTPRQDEGSVRVIRTVRRVEQSYVRLLHRNGKITDEQYAACLWYRRTFEEAGLVGKVGIARYDNVPTGGQKFFGHLPANARELEARRNYRGAQEAIGESVAALFNRVTLQDRPLLPSAKNMSRAMRIRAYSGYAALCDRLVEYLESIGIEVDRTKYDPE